MNRICSTRDAQRLCATNNAAVPGGGTCSNTAQQGSLGLPFLWAPPVFDHTGPRRTSQCATRSRRLARQYTLPRVAIAARNDSGLRSIESAVQLVHGNVSIDNGGSIVVVVVVIIAAVAESPKDTGT